MPTDTDKVATLSPEQQRIRDKCYHPTGTFIPFPKAAIEQSIPERFEEMVRLYPDRLAVKTKHETVTYAELNQHANRVARAILTVLGEGEEPVALMFEDDVQMIAVIYGILKAGKIYVPLAPFYPRARLQDMLADTGARLIVTNSKYLALTRTLAGHAAQWLNVEESNAQHADDDLHLIIPPDALASMYYTSGSTGQPKGVVETHRNRLVNAMRTTNALRICPEDRLTLLYANAFSGAVNNLFGALLNGASLFPIDLKQERIWILPRRIRENNITIYHSSPAVFRLFVSALSDEQALPSLRVLLLASDAVYKEDVKLYRQHFAPECLLLNALGATESPFFRPYFINKTVPVPASGVPAIGAPDGEDELLLLAEDGHAVRVGEVGEVVHKSRYLSPGYWCKPDVTAAKFLPDPDDKDKRLYYTGDLGRLLPDGSVVHLGRKDFQVKIRGYRIELAEIEMTLRQLDTVSEAVVVGHQSQHGERRLVAYVVAAKSATSLDLRRALLATLPDYMIPSAFVMLDTLPVTANGKVDRSLLPAPNDSRPQLEIPCVAPRTPIEAELASIWGGVLGLELVGVDDPFLELGGHSLLATQILARVVETFQVDLPLRMLLEAPTVAEMAVVITECQATQADQDAVARMLTEVETLSEEQTQNLLAEDQT